MPRTRGKAGDFHNGVEHERIRKPEEDQRMSKDGLRGPGLVEKRVQSAENQKLFDTPRPSARKKQDADES